MSEHVEGLNRDQTLLFPETLEKYVDQDNPVRFIDAFIESLNSEKIGFTHAIPAETGRPSYNPKDLLKLYIYGYLNQVRTSRRLERECHRNIEVIWLMKKLTPDHKTIADFRKDNAAGIKAVFKEFVKLCIGLGLYGKELIAVDGSKFKAVNAKEKHFNQKTLAKRIELIEKWPLSVIWRSWMLLTEKKSKIKLSMFGKTRLRRCFQRKRRVRSCLRK